MYINIIVWSDYLKKENWLISNVEKKDKYIYILKVLGTTIGVYLIMRYIFPLVVPFIFAYFISSGILPIAKWLEKTCKIPRTLSGGILLLFMIIILGIGIILLIKTLIQQGMELFANIPVYKQYIINLTNTLCSNCDSIFGLTDGQTKLFMDDNMQSFLVGLQNKFVGKIQGWTFQFAQIILGFLGGMVFLIVSILLMVQDSDRIKKGFSKTMIYQDIHYVKCKIYEAGGAYLKAQLIIFSIVATINVGGLSLLKNPYGLLIGILIGIIDSFPVLGSGTILIPWAIISVFTKNIPYAIMLMVLYFLCQVTRQILEPKLIGDKLGIAPIFTIMSIYIGFELYGILGFVLGPISLVIIRTIVETLQD